MMSCAVMSSQHTVAISRVARKFDTPPTHRFAIHERASAQGCLSANMRDAPRVELRTQVLERHQGTMERRACFCIHWCDLWQRNHFDFHG